MSQFDVLLTNASGLVDKGYLLISKLSGVKVNGAQRLVKDIQQEIVFLEKVIATKTLKKQHICSSNLHYFEGIISILEQAHGCQALMKSFYFINENVKKKIRVDVVAENGLLWIKVSSRNSKSLTQLSVGDCSYNKRSILDFAKDLTYCATQNAHNYKIPKVMFHFTQAVESELAQKLECLGVSISGKVLKQNANDPLLPPFTHHEPLKTCSVASDERFPELINLDISTMVAYVSSVSNGGTGFKFKEKVLNEQVRQELIDPLKPQLDAIFSGKKLICCETAVRRIKCILDTIGGPKEKLRLDNLLQRASIVPDVKAHEDLMITARLKEPSLTVFCTGHAHKAMTVSANKGFFHAAEHQGVKFSTWLHRSCALTEKKEKISAIENKTLDK